ncbi:MAG: biotin-dependent carboxyltransferase family protein [Paracoccaceae bacterium]|nr:MAG: biotin-dependent carboxyltransferase family protein [Paracoccaceae bacterium]
MAAGPGVTVQDGGRRGLMRHGLTPAGPMDAASHALANALLHNPPDAAAVEVTPGGLTLRVEGGPVTLAVVGGAFDIRVDGRAVGPALRLTLHPGQVMAMRAGAAGAFATLAVAGGIAVPPVLGSRATHVRSALGPFGGRALAPGDRLPAGVADLPDLPGLPAPDHGAGPVRVIPGPQAHRFAADACDRLAGTEWRLSPRSDRMAYALDGVPLVHAAGHDIVSDGVVMGAIQVPGDGLPRILMADRQTTGGYPKIACVISADLPRLAQTRPGEPVRLALTDRSGAARARADAQARAAAWLAHARAPRLTAEHLLSLNLVGGAVDARDP